MFTIILLIHDGDIGYASSYSPLTEHYVHEICGWLLSGQETRNAEMEDDRRE